MVKLLWRPVQYEAEELVMVIIWPKEVTLMEEVKASLLLASTHVVLKVSVTKVNRGQ
jgi:hypothetical protein